MKTEKKCWNCGRELISFQNDYEMVNEEGEVLESGCDEFYACNDCFYLYSKDDYLLNGYIIDAEDGETYFDNCLFYAEPKKVLPIKGLIYYDGNYKVDRASFEREVREELQKERSEWLDSEKEWEENKIREQEEDKADFQKNHICWECGKELTEIQCCCADSDGEGKYDSKTEAFGHFYVCKACRFIYSENAEMIHSYSLDAKLNHIKFGISVHDAPYVTTEENFIDCIKYITCIGKTGKADYVKYYRDSIMDIRNSLGKECFKAGLINQRGNQPAPDTLQQATSVTSQQQAKCKYCGSTSLQAVKRGANVAGAATGFFLAGWLGAFLGATSKSDGIDIICLNCKKTQ